MDHRQIKQVLQHRLVGGPRRSWVGASPRSVREALGEIAFDLGQEGIDVPQATIRAVADRIVHEIGVFGPLHPLMHDAEVTAFAVNGTAGVFAERAGRSERVDLGQDASAALRRTIERLLTEDGAPSLDGEHPFAEVGGPDGSRIHLAVPPAVTAPHLTVRKLHGGIHRLDDLVELGALERPMADYLRAAVRARLNILVSGAPGTGKTTLLEQLARSIAAAERIVVIENTVEMRLDQPDVVRLLGSGNGHGPLDARTLLRNAMRMRPMRLVLGGITGREARDYLHALGAGYAGTLAAIRAPGPEEAVERLEALADSGPDFRRMIGSGLDLIVQLRQLADGTRRIVRITEVGPGEGRPSLRDVFAFQAGRLTDGRVEGEFVATDHVAAFHDRLVQHGYEG